MTVKTCTECGAVIRTNRHESRAKHARRVTCSRACLARRFRRLGAERHQHRRVKCCAECGALMRWNGIEAFHLFESRRFCGVPCQRVAQSAWARRQSRTASRRARCADPRCGHPLADRQTVYCTARDNPVCWGRRQQVTTVGAGQSLAVERPGGPS